MKKWLLTVGFVLTLVASGPAAATAAPVQGVVVAKNSLRKAVVVAAPNGSARTLAVPGWKSVRLGSKISANARALADGSFSARALRSHGRVRQARLRAIVVRYERSAGRYVVSAGGSVFALRSSASRVLAAATEEAPAAQPGAQVVTTVDVTSTTPQAQQVTQIGQVGKLSIEGIILELSGSSLKLVVPQVGFVTVAVPAGLDISRFKVFDQVRISASVGADGSFTLLSMKGKGGLSAGGTSPVGREDDDDDDDDDSDDSEDDESEDSDDSDD